MKVTRAPGLPAAPVEAGDGDHLLQRPARPALRGVPPAHPVELQAVGVVDHEVPGGRGLVDERPDDLRAVGPDVDGGHLDGFATHRFVDRASGLGRDDGHEVGPTGHVAPHHVDAARILVDGRPPAAGVGLGVGVLQLQTTVLPGQAVAPGVDLALVDDGAGSRARRVRSMPGRRAPRCLGGW